MDPKLEALLRAAIDVTTVAFTDQKLVVKTPLHEPMQRLMDALSAYPPHWDVLKLMNDEYRAAAPSRPRAPREGRRMAESHVTIHFEASANIHGDDEAGAQRWKLIADVLKALGCVDIILRETDRHPGTWHCEDCRKIAVQNAAFDRRRASEARTRPNAAQQEGS